LATLGALTPMLGPWKKSQNSFNLFLNITNAPYLERFLNANLTFFGLTWPLKKLHSKRCKYQQGCWLNLEK
jgi:hypothetical protein